MEATPQQTDGGYQCTGLISLFSLTIISPQTKRKLGGELLHEDRRKLAGHGSVCRELWKVHLYLIVTGVGGT